MKITIVGAGNIGFVLAAVLSKNKKNNIYIFTYKTDLLNKKIIFNDYETSNKFVTKNFIITSNPEEAFEKTDLILCTYPAFLREKFIITSEEYISKNTIIGFVPGYGGIEFLCKNLIKKGVIVFGMQRVPYIARSNVENREIVANMLSKKKSIYIATLPLNKTLDICYLLEKLLEIPCYPLKEYLAVTLVPSNPLLHTVGLYNIFKRSVPSSIFKNQIYFYDEWNDSSSKLLLEYDNELQKICKELKPLVLSEVVSLAKYYEVTTPQEMTKKLKSIQAFKSVTAPLKKVNEGFILDLNSRMFIEDFPFGVCIIKDIAIILGIETPAVDIILKFYEEVSGYKYFNSDGSPGKDYNTTGAPRNYGIKTKEDLINFYHGGN